MVTVFGKLLCGANILLYDCQEFYAQLSDGTYGFFSKGGVPCCMCHKVFFFTEKQISAQICDLYVSLNLSTSDFLWVYSLWNKFPHYGWIIKMLLKPLALPFWISCLIKHKTTQYNHYQQNHWKHKCVIFTKVNVNIKFLYLNHKNQCNDVWMGAAGAGTLDFKLIILYN